MKKLILALVVVSAFGSAHAQRAYVGAGLLAAGQNFDFPLSGFSNAGGDHYTASPKLFLGYDFNQTWGVEAGFSKFRSADYHYTYAGQDFNGQTKGRSMYVAAKVTLPITEQLSFVGKLGVSDNKRSVSDGIFWDDDSKTGVYTSIGVQYPLTEKVSVNLDYEQYGRRHHAGLKANAFSLSAKFAF